MVKWVHVRAATAVFPLIAAHGQRHPAARQESSPHHNRRQRPRINGRTAGASSTVSGSPTPPATARTATPASAWRLGKSIVEAHGGTISVAAIPGEWATFTISLPV